MAFFPRQFYNDTTSFTPLFRLLDDFDNYSRQNNGARRSGLPHWQPKFDVRETAEAYELHGELPGVDKNDVHIEFTDPQVMVIRGKSERVYTAGAPPSGHFENSQKQGAITESGDADKNSHKATVEDANETENQKQVQASDSTSGEVAKQTEQNQPTDKAKYWVSERSVGEFARSFNFPTRVDQDGVTANFKDGILNISVPKAKKHESRRIAVN